MNRRSFIQSAASAFVGVKAIGEFSEEGAPFTVAVHQTDELTSWFQKQDEKMENESVAVARTAINDIFNDHFETEFEVIEGELTIPESIVEPPFYEDYNKRFTSLIDWSMNSPNNSADMNLLNAFYSNRTTGVASHAEMPDFLSETKPHGITWGGYYGSNQQHAMRAMAHEIGHGAGLRHFYGTNLESENGERSLMLHNSFAKKVGYNVFGESIEPTGEFEKCMKINPKVTDEHLLV